MKWLYCWRCQCDIPMLDEKEYAEIHRVRRNAFRLHMRPEAIDDSSSQSAVLEEVSRLVLDAYEQLTGFSESNINAVFHHRIALYGPPCSVCGKPLRTPQASYCVACGASGSSEG